MGEIVSFDAAKRAKTARWLEQFVGHVLELRNPDPLPYLVSIATTPQGLAEGKAHLLNRFALDEAHYWNLFFHDERAQQYFLTHPELQAVITTGGGRIANPGAHPFPWVIGELGRHGFLHSLSYFKAQYRGSGRVSCLTVDDKCLFPEALKSEPFIKHGGVLAQELAEQRLQDLAGVLLCEIHDCTYGVPLLQRACEGLDQPFSVVCYSWGKEGRPGGVQMSARDFASLGTRDVIGLASEISRRIGS